MARRRAATAVVTLLLLAVLPPAVASARAGSARVGPDPRERWGAREISVADKDLGRTAGEVVVWDASGASPRVTKWRTGSVADARALAAELDAQPGVTATVNAAYREVEPPGEALGAVRVAGRGAERAGTPRAGAPDSEPLYDKQWAFDWLGLDTTWSSATGAGITVAVIDSGVAAGHPDLAGQVVAGVDLVHDGLAPADGRGDPRGHGTFVAGIIAAGINGKGIAGAASDARILPIRVLDDKGEGDTYTTASGILEAVDRGATVINMSLGGPGKDPVQRDAVAYAISRGVVVVASVGNDYEDGNPVNYPAAYPDVIGVSAMTANGTRASFANTGPQVDLTAPGVDIVSDLPESSYASGDGTSFSAPYVSAVAALVRQAAPGLSGAQVAKVLLDTAQDDAAGDGRDNRYGYGLVRADKALAAAVTITPSPSPSPSGSPSGAGSPTPVPSGSPSASPTGSPGVSPTASPSPSPTRTPSVTPTPTPTARVAVRLTRPALSRTTVAAGARVLVRGQLTGPDGGVPGEAVRVLLAGQGRVRVLAIDVTDAAGRISVVVRPVRSGSVTFGYPGDSLRRPAVSPPIRLVVR